MWLEVHTSKEFKEDDDNQWDKDFTKQSCIKLIQYLSCEIYSDVLTTHKSSEKEVS